MTAFGYSFEALRGVGNVELVLDAGQRVYTFFGTNGVGKTKCLEALFQAHLLKNKTFADFLASLLHEEKLLVAKSFSLPDGSVLRVSQDNALARMTSYRELSEQAALGLQWPVVFLGAGRRADIKAGARDGHPIGTFEERRKNYFTSLLDGMNKNFSELGMGLDIATWFVTRAQSANPYQKDADNRKVEIETLLNLLHAVDERFDSSFLQLAGDNRISLKVAGQVTALEHLSSGFASLLKMLQSIISGYANFTNEVQLTHVRGIVLIDEVESHLHSAWQARIIPLLKSLFPNTTFFVATHSPLVLSQLQEGEAYLLQRDERGVVRSEKIGAPNRRAFADVLDDAFGVDLNALKRQSLEQSDQTLAKKGLLNLLQGLDS